MAVKMNRLECLQHYPSRCRQIFYFAAPTIAIFFGMAILTNFFGIPFKEASTFWYIPGFIGGAFTFYMTQTRLDEEDVQKTKKKQDIEVDPDYLKGELEKSNEALKYLVGGLIGIFAITIILRPPFYREIGQVADLAVMCGFFFLSSYFREVLHVYSRTPGFSDEELGGYYANRSFFSLLGWLSLFFFFQKTLFLKGKMGNAWSELSNFSLSDSLLGLSLAIYLLGTLGLMLKTYTQKKDSTLSSIFLACVAFGSFFPLVWLYPYAHSFLFSGIPVWTIQLPFLLLAMIISIGTFLSHQGSLQNKILGNACLSFFKHCGQVFMFIALWKGSITLTDMTPVSGLVFYGLFIIAMFYTAKRATYPGFIILVALLGFLPFFPKIMNGELVKAIEGNRERSTC